MQIKTPQSYPARRRAGFLSRKRGILAATVLVVFLGYSLLLLAGGAFLFKRGFYGDVVQPCLHQRWRVATNYVGSLFAPPAPRLEISIKHLDYEKLRFQRETALAKNALMNAEFVPAKIKLAGKEHQVKIRLKGDHVDHLRSDKWSLRVKVQGSDTILGMKLFSLQHPRTRNYLYEWIYHQALHREDVLSLRYGFLRVLINGREHGIYAIEEGFEKRLVEHNRRREGPIVRFNENLRWDEMLQFQPYDIVVRQSGYGAYQAANIDAFQTGKVLRDSTLRGEYYRAAELLTAFRRGELPTSRVFHTARLADYFALVDLLGAEHGARWHNIRFYYDPLTGLLEPIGFDGNAGQPLKRLVGVENGIGVPPEHLPETTYYRQIFHDPQFFRLYMQSLERFSRPEYLDSLFRDLEEELKPIRRILFKEYPHHDFEEAVLRRNAALIREKLHPKHALRGYVQGFEEGRLHLMVGALQHLPVEVTGVVTAAGEVLPVQTDLLLPGRLPDETVAYADLYVKLPAETEVDSRFLKHLEVRYRLLGLKEDAQEKVLSYALVDPPVLKGDPLRESSSLTDFPFLEVDKAAGIITCRPGNWRLERDLLIPPGFRFQAGPGVQLDLTGGAAVVSFSPLRFVGSVERPIRVVSSDSTGSGILVVNAHAPSRLYCVDFENLGAPSFYGYNITGSVTFYESPFTAELCSFRSNRCEDALNAVRTEFTLQKADFVNTWGDALDGDFCRGKLSASRFRKIGNDAVDISGSDLEMTDVEILGCGDKGVSAGEDSRLRGHDLRIARAEIGVSSKDLSRVELTGVALDSCTTGMVLLQKKSEFGPAFLQVSEAVVRGTRELYLLEEDSRLILNGREQPFNRSHGLRQTLYAKEKSAGKNSGATAP